jgi:phosphatidylserine/phosphatidylglycerophosphate/cardiolipin synthase-like enzyme
MYTRNIFYATFIILLSYNAYSMKRTYSIPANTTLPPLLDKYTPETLITEIQKHIAVPDLIAINSLLSMHTATKLSQNQKNTLYELAIETEKAINTQIMHIKSSSQKDLSLYSAQQKNLIEIINLLYAFKFLTGLKFPQALFTPPPYKDVLNRQNLDEALKALIANEQEKIYVCCFHLTLRSLADSLVNAKNNGISIEVIIDKEQLYGDLAAIRILQENKISILAPQNAPYEAMHHKFFIFKKNIRNKSLIWTGSYNPTGHGNERSWDDVVILDNPAIAEEYIKRFEEVKNRSK